MSSELEVKNKATKNITLSPLLSIGSSFINDETLLFSDPITKKRALVNREAFLAMLIDSNEKNQVTTKLVELGMILSEENFPNEKVISHWYRRGWGPSLEYYLWSRDCDFYDDEDNSNSNKHREEVLTSYLQDDKPKERIKPIGEVINLPKNMDINDKKTLGEILCNRRTTRKFLEQPLTLEVFSQILWNGFDMVRRTRVSSSKDLLGFLQSYGVAFDFYFIIYSIESIEPGVYYYDLPEHKLIQVDQGQYRLEMSKNIIEQIAPMTAGFTLCCVVDIEQYLWRYRHERALRHVYMEVGRISQNFIITGSTQNLSTLTTPAMLDKKVSKLLKLNETRQIPLYTLTMGLTPKK